MDLMSVAFISTFLAAAVAGTLPLLLAAVGETVSERSGVLNLGIEGMLLLGGYSAFVVTLNTGSYALGMVAGAATGGVASIVMIVLNVWLALNQIVLGLAVTLIGTGLTSVLYLFYYSDSRPRLGTPPSVDVPLLSEIPVLGTVIFSQSTIFWGSLVAIVVVAWILSRSQWGLSVKACGQKPSALDAAGGNVLETRSVSVLFGGVFAGFGGAYLVLVTTGAFTPFMTNGMGFIAIVITMLGKGSIRLVAAAAFLYGLTVAVGTALQLTPVTLPIEMITMLPFVVIMIVLMIFARSAYIPPALVVPYVRGSR